MSTRPSRSTAIGTLLCSALLQAGCGGGGGTESRVPTTVVVTPASVSFTAIGQARQLSATVTDQDGATIASPTLVWASSNTAVATVTTAGLVSAAGNGAARITATAGSATASAELSVAQTPAQIQRVSGDQQTGTVAQALPQPLIVQVNDANSVPVPGAAVTYVAPSDAATLDIATAATGADGRAATTLTVLATGAIQVTAGVTGTSLATTFSETGTSPFTIELRFLTTPTPAQSQAFTAAQRRWQGLIVGDIADVGLNAAAGTCGADSPDIQQLVDDVLILVTLEPIDDAGGVLGAAAPCYVRSTSMLTVMGTMRFDTADLALLENVGLLQAVVVHEMGHVLGFGTLWPSLGVLADPSLSGGTDPHFTGPQALAAFDAAGGGTYTGAKVPVETTGGAGTADAHWRESVLDTELMTGFVQQGVNPLSRISVASLADLGYSMNLQGADPYTLAPALKAFGRGRSFELANDRLHLPVRVVNEHGQVLRVIAP